MKYIPFPHTQYGKQYGLHQWSCYSSSRLWACLTAAPLPRSFQVPRNGATAATATANSNSSWLQHNSRQEILDPGGHRAQHRAMTHLLTDLSMLSPLLQPMLIQKKYKLISYIEGSTSHTPVQYPFTAVDCSLPCIRTLQNTDEKSAAKQCQSWLGVLMHSSAWLPPTPWSMVMSL